MSRLDQLIATRVRRSVIRYAETDYGDVLKIQGTDPPSYRLRVGDYRVLFHVDEPAANDKDRREWLVVEHVLHRREAYR